jgi:hypothetical protein
LLAGLADATELTAACSGVLGQLRPRGTGHDVEHLESDL